MFYRHNFLWSSASRALKGVCTLHSTDLLAWSQDAPQLDDVHSGVVNQLATPFRAMLGTSFTLDEIVSVTVPDPNQPSQVPSSLSTSIALAGTRSLVNADLPARIGGLIGWTTTLTGRSFRGRMFCPPLESTNEVTADLLAVAGDYHLAMQAFANRVLDGNRIGPGADYGGLWDSQAHSFNVYSPTRHKLNQPPAMTIINGFKLTRKLAYLSSRDR